MLIKKSGLTPYRVSDWSDVNAGNLSKFLNGKRLNPEAETVHQLCAALSRSGNIALFELDMLLMSAGYAPVYAISHWK